MGSLVIGHINLNQKSIFYAAEMFYGRFLRLRLQVGHLKVWSIFDGASIMTGERHAASLLDVIAFLLGKRDVGLPASWMLLWLGSADLPQGSITPRCTQYEDSFNKDMSTNEIKKMVYVLQFANNCFSPERHSDLICNEPRLPTPSNSLAPGTKVHGTITLTHSAHAHHDPNHLGYSGNQWIRLREFE